MRLGDCGVGIDLKRGVIEFGELKLVAKNEKFSFGWVKG